MGLSGLSGLQQGQILQALLKKIPLDGTVAPEMTFLVAVGPALLPCVGKRAHVGPKAI